jgi:hypothetical protein
MNEVERRRWFHGDSREYEHETTISCDTAAALTGEVTHTVLSWSDTRFVEVKCSVTGSKLAQEVTRQTYFDDILSWNLG